jgi:hypothetical protein
MTLKLDVYNLNGFHFPSGNENGDEFCIKVLKSELKNKSDNILDLNPDVDRIEWYDEDKLVYCLTKFNI